MSSEDESSSLEISNNNKVLIHEVFKLEADGHKDARDLFKEEITGFLIRTDDGSFTLASDKREDEFETLHSTFGARTEAFQKFVIPSKILEKAENSNVVKVLDICSGIGYNVSALLDYLNDVDVEIEIDMVESSLETLATTLFIPDICESHQYVKKAIETYLIEKNYLQFNKVLSNIPSNVTINIHVCDARDFIKNCDDKEYDAVFLDPFSPAKCPELYTVDFFSRLKQFLTPTALILTYTAASPVRSAFVDVGLHVGEGPRFHRSGGTIASRSPDLIETPLSFSDVKVIALSDVGIPYLDPYLNDDYKTIIERRQKQRKLSRGNTTFPSSGKLPRYLGLDPNVIEDENLRNKLTSYVQEMGFSSLDDERIINLLDIDLNLYSRDQILTLKDKLHDLLK
ncbi:MnmC family methyltransferase [Methanosphaera sp.]|uniref:MnmC family methyltransferase n=1 Tax=Methanosphaera sp. TaxID=2666342 RepID=UPI002E78DD2C|nr:MnmC family methyltransferase [Methanosphaera sp.]MEE1117063.1 MnmC family methyltransferase [Methanosphaera sp.]